MKIIISNTSDDPIYEQISKQIKAAIIDGTLDGGSLLPSIRNLARDLQVSVITVKRSYEELENEGFINTVAGKGSFVAAQNAGFLKEQKLKQVEKILEEAVGTSKCYGITLETLQQLLSLLYGEE